MPRAVWNGTVIAESEETVELEGNHYFAPTDVRDEYLEPAPQRSVCPWKGVADYYDVVVGGRRNSAAAWFYSSPSPGARQIEGRIAFWKGVQIEA